MSTVNRLITVTASAMSRKENDGSLKGKHGLVRSTLGDGLLESVLRRELNSGVEEV